MSVKRNKLMTITQEKGIQLYLSTLETEGKSPRYIDWLKTRLGYFLKFIYLQYGETFMLQDLAVDDGREFVRELLNRDTKYRDHPLTKSKPGKLAIQYVHGCGRAVHSFSSWAYEEGYLDENVMRLLKLPQLCPRRSPSL